MIIQEIELIVGDNLEYCLTLKKAPSSEEERTELIYSFGLYFVKCIYNLGKGMFTAQLLDIYFSEVLPDIMLAAESGQKSKKLLNSEYLQIKTLPNNPITFKCIVKKEGDNYAINTPWSKLMQESEDQEHLIEQSISSFLHFLNEYLTSKELIMLGLILGGISHYYQNVGNYWNLISTKDALPYAINWAYELALDAGVDI